jgi:hypothetical protein
MELLKPEFKKRSQWLIIIEALTLWVLLAVTSTTVKRGLEYCRGSVVT